MNVILLGDMREDLGLVYC